MSKKPTFVSKLAGVDSLSIDRAAVVLAQGVVEYFGTGHIPKCLDGDVALRAAAYSILAKAGLPKPKGVKEGRQPG